MATSADSVAATAEASASGWRYYTRYVFQKVYAAEKAYAAEPLVKPHQEPALNYMLWYTAVLLLSAIIVFGGFRRSRDFGSSPTRLLRFCGVSLRKVSGAMREIERKGFHIAGLLVPLVHLLMLRFGYDNAYCVKLCCWITVVGCCADGARLHIPFVAAHWPMRKILREAEQHQLTGGCYFSLGCTVAIAMSPPSVAMASILFLVMGDMTAAIIGVSFGGDKLGKHRLGREGKKSLEGSLAM